MPVMKKTFLVCLTVAVLLFAVNVFAADNSVPEISIVSNEESIISVSGTTDANDRVTLLILNPGATEAQLAEASASAELSGMVQYMDVAWPNANGKYEFNPVQMNDTCDGGGLFKVIVTVGSQKLTPIDYYFYFYDAKLDALDAVNNATCTASNLREAYKKMGLSDFNLYKNGSIDKMCEAVELLKNATATGKLERNLDTFYDALVDAAYLAGFNAHNESLLIKDGKLAYAEELLGLKNTQVWADYSNIKTNGKKLFHQKLISKSYDSLDEVRTEFEELVAFYGILYYKDAGFGHLDSFFTNYEDVYEKYRFDLDEINSGNRNYVYRNLISDKVNDLTALARRFNKLVSDDGKGGGSGGSSSHSGGSGYDISAPITAPDSYIIPEDKFIDLVGFSWAEKEIEELRDKGIISGRTPEIFAPADYVTRAEFLKMLMSVYNIASTSTECKFIDVPDDWSRPYVIAAFENGIATGVTETEFNPTGLVTREMSTVFAVRALENQEHVLEKDKTVFADDASISPYASESVYKLKTAGIISGVGNNSFNPQGYLTRAEAAKIIYGIMLYN